MLSQLNIQYRAIKNKYKAMPIFKVGDFYETLNGSAIMLSQCTGITLTRDSNNRPLAGFPYNMLDKYLPMLIKSGIKVAIVEETV
jgi:DNA mismatch repair protein MutS